MSKKQKKQPIAEIAYSALQQVRLGTLRWEHLQDKLPSLEGAVALRARGKGFNITCIKWPYLSEPGRLGYNAIVAITDSLAVVNLPFSEAQFVYERAACTFN